MPLESLFDFEDADTLDFDYVTHQAEDVNEDQYDFSISQSSFVPAVLETADIQDVELNESPPTAQSTTLYMPIARTRFNRRESNLDDFEGPSDMESPKVETMKVKRGLLDFAALSKSTTSKRNSRQNNEDNNSNRTPSPVPARSYDDYSTSSSSPDDLVASNWVVSSEFPQDSDSGTITPHIETPQPPSPNPFTRHEVEDRVQSDDDVDMDTDVSD